MKRMFMMAALCIGLAAYGGGNTKQSAAPTRENGVEVLYFERLQKDLQRAGIANKWWVVNACRSLTDTHNAFLRAKAHGEQEWIRRVEELSDGNAALIAWRS